MEKIKKLKEITLKEAVIIEPLSREQLKAVIGGTDEVFASGETKTHSGSMCDGTAVCNCKCGE